MSHKGFEAIAERYLHIVLRGPEEYMAQCPFCSGEATLQFNVRKGLWNCFKCGDGGTAKRLVKKIGGEYSDPDVSIEVLQTALDILRTSQKNKNVRPKILEDNYLLRFQGDSPNGYWENRGFTAATREKWGLGYDPISDRCTIAYRNSGGELLGVIQRRLDNTFPRYIYPKGFDRAGSLFGSWEVTGSRGDEVALVEGSTDCIALDQCGFLGAAQYGSSISLRQTKLLRRMGVRKITLFYDYDEAGRKAEEQALEMLDGFFVSVVAWDETRYCWHKKLCGCGEHGWKAIAMCQKRVLCTCGRKHEMDPGKLEPWEISKMFQSPVLRGRKGIAWNSTWPSTTRKSARSRTAQKKVLGE